MHPRFTPTTDPNPTGVRITDPILQREYKLETPTPVEPDAILTDGFYFPVDSATTIETDELLLQGTVSTYVRGPDGDMQAEISHNDLEQFETGQYFVELNAPVKLLLRFDSAFEVATADDRMEFSFPTGTTVAIGARSFHDQPAGTITTTDAPGDLRQAIEALSSSLKTTSCERSWPTLRGHPPRIEVGDNLSIPDEFDTPETGVTITTPNDRDALYAVAPLAFYLGADLAYGAECRLQTEAGLDHRLTYRETFADDPTPPTGPPHDVGRLLKHVVTLDCLTRTEGFYDVALHEREEFEANASVQLDFAALYGQSLAVQLDQYLSVPYADVQSVMPTWRLVADVRPDGESAELLPYLANDLGIVRVASDNDHDADPDPPEPPDLSSFARGSDTQTPPTTGPVPEFDRGVTSDASDPEYVTPPDADALEQVWVGSGRPFGVGKLLAEGFEHKLAQNGSRSAEDAEIEIAVVCNDGAMDAEYSDELYGDREQVRYDVTEYRDLSVHALREVFESNLDFVHFIGHVEDGGFVCRDGRLDPRDLSTVGVGAFLLNGCRSYQTGVELVRSGGVGGIVTHSDVGNDAAVEIGRVTARLLNIGFSLRSALAIAKDQRLVGNQYLVVGDGGTSVFQTVSGTPYKCGIETRGEDLFELSIYTYPTVDKGIGAIFQPYIGDQTQYYLSGGPAGRHSVSKPSLARFLTLQEAPVQESETFCWASNITL